MGYTGWIDPRRGKSRADAREVTNGHIFLVTYWKLRGFKHDVIAHALGVSKARVSQLWRGIHSKTRNDNRRSVVRPIVAPHSITFDRLRTEQMPLPPVVISRLQSMREVVLARDLRSVTVGNFLCMPGVGPKHLRDTVLTCRRYVVPLHPSVDAWLENWDAKNAVRQKTGELAA